MVQGSGLWRKSPGKAHTPGRSGPNYVGRRIARRARTRPTRLATLTLVAEGNVFTGVDCSVSAAMLTRGGCVAGTRTDVGIGNAQTASILTNMFTN